MAIRPALPPTSFRSHRNFRKKFRYLSVCLGKDTSNEMRADSTFGRKGEVNKAQQLLNEV